MRVSLEGLGQAVDGDLTTTGTICIATGAGYLEEGPMVLREGDHTTPSVPVCGIVIVGASSAAGSIGLGTFGEKAGEVLYEVIDD